MMNKLLSLVEGREENHRIPEDLAVATKALGWKMKIIKTIGSIEIAENNFDQYFSDFVFWRGLKGNSHSENMRMKYILAKTDRVMINVHEVGGYGATSDKFYQHGMFLDDPILKDYVLPAYEAFSKDFIVNKLINQNKIQYPFVLKPKYGTAGRGIVLIRNEEELENANTNEMIVEQYVEEECSFRVFVIGGVAIGVMRKIGNADDPGDFKAKSAGTEKYNETDPDVVELLSKLSIHAAEISNFEYVGVDFIRDLQGKYYIMETNISAGWQNGFPQTTGVDVPKEVLLYFEAMGLMKFDGKSEEEAREIMDRRREELGLQKIPWYGKIDVSKFK